MNDNDKIALIAHKARYDLFFLAKEILKYNLMEEHVHKDLCEYVQTLLPSHPAEYLPPEEKNGDGMEDQFHIKNKNQLLLMPRGTFKSSVVTIGFTLQYLLNDANSRILIDSETYGKAKAFFAEIRGHLENNELYREVFRFIHGMYPNGVDKKGDLLWTSTELNIAARTRWRKEPSISCGAVDHAVNGMHYDMIICDDLHSEKNVTNIEQIKQVIDHWRLAYSLLDPGMPMIIIGTRWDYNDLYQHILDYKRDSYNILIRSAMNDDGSLFFPERLTQAFLKETRETQGSRIFSAQYLNNPVDDETATFKRDNIIRRDWDLVKDRPINWYLSIDPSYQGEYSDYAALVVVGMDYQRDLYVRHVLRKKMTYADIINGAFDLYIRYRPKYVLLETVATQKSIMVELNNQQKRRNLWLPLKEIKSRPNSKEERIRGLAPFYEFGHIFHVKDCPQLEELEDELIHFPRGKHDDIIDALASVLEFASPPNPGKFDRSVRDGDKPRVFISKPRSRITGV